MVPLSGCRCPSGWGASLQKGIDMAFWRFDLAIPIDALATDELASTVHAAALPSV